MALAAVQRDNNFLGWYEAREVAVKVYARARRADLAVPLIEKLLDPSDDATMPYAWLRLNPELDPIRSDPAFQALLKAHPGSGERFASE